MTRVENQEWPLTQVDNSEQSVTRGEEREQPLTGDELEPTVALTHSPGRLPGLAELLEARGFRVLHQPLLRVSPRLDPKTTAAAARLLELPWILLTSRSTIGALSAMGCRLETLRAGVVGPGTREELEEAGGTASLLGHPHDAGGLLRAFLAHPDATGPIGLPRGSRALPDLEEGLIQAGYAVRPLVVYDSVALQWQGPAAEITVLASPSALAALPGEVTSGTKLVAIGNTTASAVRERGLKVLVATSPTPEGVLEAVEGWRRGANR